MNGAIIKVPSEWEGLDYLVHPQGRRSEYRVLCRGRAKCLRIDLDRHEPDYRRSLKPREGGVMPKRIITLDVTSAIGLSLGASHYYGKLSDGEVRVELMRVLTAAGARKLNILHRAGNTYHAGDEVTNWDSEEGLIAFAKRTWRDHYPCGVLLILGDGAGPHPILVGPDDVVAKGAALLRKAAAIGYWDERKNWPKMDAICKQWDALLISIDGTPEDSMRRARGG